MGESLRRPTNHSSPTGKVHANKILSLVPCIEDTKDGNCGRGNSKKNGKRVQIMKYGGYGGSGGMTVPKVVLWPLHTCIYMYLCTHMHTHIKKNNLESAGGLHGTLS